MRIVVGLLLFLLNSLLVARAQPNTMTALQGTVVDSASRQALPQATVSLLSAADSSLITVRLADAQGRFVFSNIPKGTYALTISYVGYTSLSRPVVVPAVGQTLTVGTLILRPRTVRLGEVTVQRHAPVTIRNDTLEFDAGSFATQPNALVEDLLRKLPGVDVTGDGSVRAQGRVVQQVFVDGKPFFGNDPKMATRNLPAYLIDKIQVFDKRSDQSAFSGVDDGGRVRTINIVTKPEGRRGQFGQQVVGYGTNGRYQAGGGINRFGQQTQFSLLGQTNNVNQVGYGLPAYGPRSSIGNGTTNAQGQSGGITRSTGVGFNYADRWGKRTQVAASYLIANATTLTGQNGLRQTVLPGATSRPAADTTRLAVISHTDNRTTTRALNHSFHLRLDYQLDSMNVIRVSPGFSGHVNNNASRLTIETLTGRQAPLNQNLSDNASAGTNRSVNNTLLWMHRFHRPGRTLSLNLNTALNRLVSDGSNRAQTVYYGQQPGQDSLLPVRANQRSTQRTRSTTNDLTLSYTEPLRNQQTIEFRYNLSTNQSNSERLVSDVDETTGADRLNTSLSSRYHSAFVTNRLGSGLAGTQAALQLHAGHRHSAGRSALCLPNGDESAKPPVRQPATKPCFPSAVGSKSASSNPVPDPHRGSFGYVASAGSRRDQPAVCPGGESGPAA